MDKKRLMKRLSEYTDIDEYMLKSIAEAYEVAMQATYEPISNEEREKLLNVIHELQILLGIVNQLFSHFGRSKKDDSTITFNESED